ncbi:Vesicle transport through interaction with t-SNAREs 1A, partial [Cladochytrium tenue]
MAEAESAVFDTYQKEFLALQAAVADKIRSAIPAAQEPDAKKLLVNQCRRELEEADEIIGQMDMEAASLGPAAKERLQPRIKSFKEELRRAKKDLTAALTEREQLLGGTGSGASSRVITDLEAGGGGGASEAQRARLLRGTERLQDASRRLDDARRVALDAEAAGVDTLAALSGQREQILRARDRLQTADGWVTKSQGLLKTMQY